MMQNHTGHFSMDPVFQALRINMQDKICKWFERKYANRTSEWKQKLPDIAKMLEESIYKESLNKDDYISKCQSGIESRIISMQNQQNQKRQQQLHQQQLSQQQNQHQTMAHHNIQSNSSVSGMMIPTLGISHNPTGTMRMSSSMESNQGINLTSGPAEKITDLTAGINSIPMLTGSNYKNWKDNLEIFLGCLDLDTVLQEAKPPVPVETSTEKEQTAYARWVRSNRLCLQVMQKTIPESFRGPVSDSTLAKDYLKELEQRFVRNEKAEIGILLNKLCTMKYHGKSNVREHILEMMHTASKLKGHKLDISDDMLVYLALNSLPASFGQFKVSYNCQKDSWTVNELILHCAQEEERLKSDKSESANIASTSKGKGKQKRNANSDATTTSS